MENNFCCLGVLCDLYDSSKWHRPDKDHDYSMFDEKHYLTDEVKEWAGLTNSDPEVYYDDNWCVVSELNDECGLGFKKIADLIEKHL